MRAPKTADDDHVLISFYAKAFEGRGEDKEVTTPTLLGSKYPTGVEDSLSLCPEESTDIFLKDIRGGSGSFSVIAQQTVAQGQEHYIIKAPLLFLPGVKGRKVSEYIV